MSDLVLGPTTASPSRAVPDYKIVDQEFHRRYSLLKVRRQLQRFDIKIEVKDLQDDDLDRYRKFYNRLRAWNAGAGEDPRPEICGWIMEACRRAILVTAPAIPLHRPVTLHAFYYPDTYDISVSSNDGRLVGDKVGGKCSRCWESEMAQVSDFPLLAAQVKYVASQVEIAREVQPGQSLDEIPTYVRVGSEGPKVYILKPARAAGFVDEVRKYWDIWRAFPSGLPEIAQIWGYVRSEKYLIGLMIDIGPVVGTLQSEECINLTQYHAQWKEQVTRTVKRLHEKDITWGSPHPKNIIVDKDYNARITDFSNSTGAGYIPREKIGTMDGDLEGIESVFGELLMTAFVENSPTLVSLTLGSS